MALDAINHSYGQGLALLMDAIIIAYKCCLLFVYFNDISLVPVVLYILMASTINYCHDPLKCFVNIVLAIELLAACQAIEFLRPLKSTPPLEEVYKLVRTKVG